MNNIAMKSNEKGNDFFMVDMFVVQFGWLLPMRWNNSNLAQLQLWERY